MRNSPLKGLVRKGNSQGLNPEALASKRARDLVAANNRSALRNESQIERRKKSTAFLKGKDHDHYTGSFVSSSKNRAGMNPNKKGTKNE